MTERKKELTVIIAVRLTPEDRQRLNTLAERMQAIPRLSLARAALRIGMQALEDDPARLFVAQKSDALGAAR